MSTISSWGINDFSSFCTGYTGGNDLCNRKIKKGRLHVTRQPLCFFFVLLLSNHNLLGQYYPALRFKMKNEQAFVVKMDRYFF